jgi:putative phage-type endonuclease
MSAILKVVQGSNEWHAHRAEHRNASETPAVLGVSPWVTPYQLWLQRTGRAVTEVNPAMVRGTQLEPAAREAYERLTGNVMEPLVLVEGDYSASLDGITLDGALILEIKCPFNGRESDLWKDATRGNLPEHYRWQVQHQLMVAGAALAHVYVFDGTQGILVEEKPRRDDWRVIAEGWDDFMRLIAEDKAPPFGDRDTVQRTDAEWTMAAKTFVAAKEAVEAATARLEAARSALTGLTSHTSEKGAGVAVARFWKAGSIDYKQVPELAGVDLEKYRAPSREEVRVSITK